MLAIVVYVVLGFIAGYFVARSHGIATTKTLRAQFHEMHCALTSQIAMQARALTVLKRSHDANRL